MRRKIVWTVFSLLFILATLANAEPVFFPRFPGISPDGSEVIFTFQGDLWRVPAAGGQATRLTAHPAYDANAVYSPDGKFIAFSSDRFGNTDLFVIPTIGGTPTQLSYATAGDIPQAWAPDGKSILFATRRMFDFPMGGQIYSIPAEGGTPFRFADFFASEIVPAGENTYVFSRGDNEFGRRGYHGSYSAEIWSWTVGSEPVQLTENDVYDSDPMFANGKVYYRSEANGKFNIWSMNLDGSNKTELTQFPDLGARNARISDDGSTIVIEAETDLYLLNIATGQTSKMNIEIAADMIENLVSTKSYSGDASEFAMSEEGEEAAVVIEGELVLFNTELEGRARVAVPDPARDEYISYKPGTADTLMFVSDRSGRKSIYLLVSDDENESNLRLARKHKIVELTPSKKFDGKDCRFPRWSPDGKKIAFLSDKGNLQIMNPDGSKIKMLVPHWSIDVYFNWAPDGNWIAFQKPDNNYNSDIWIVDVNGKQDPVNISQHPDEDVSPVWSADGSMIAWSTMRHANQFDIYYLYLKQSDHERSKEEWEIWEKTRDKKKDDDAEGEDEDKDDEEKEEEFVIQIDFDDIYLRGRRATSLPADEYAVAIDPKGDKIYFTAEIDGDRDLYSVNRFGKDMKGITSGGTSPSNINLDEEGKKFYFLKSGKPAHVASDGGSVETYSFNARITLDKAARRMQVMDEGWRGLNSGFYDPNMHGIDWAAIRTQFEAYIPKVSHDRDFADLMMMMLRTLNASHMGYYPSGRSSWYGIDGYLGLEFDQNYNGEGLKVAKLLRHGPADKVDKNLMVGDIITHVGDIPVSKSQNFYYAMDEADGQPVYVTFKRGKEKLEYQLRPVSWMDIRGQVYDNWQKEKLEYTVEKSNGRVGYTHIEGMGLAQVELFERDLYAIANDKDALIIDVRNNGGGWTTDLLLTILTQPVHAFTVGRDGEVGYPQPRYPLYSWRKPIAVICNEQSYSNAEIFSHAVKTIGRGPVVGIPTGGNVISTWGWTVMDDGHVRLPMRGWYIWGDEKHPERNGVNQEHNGCIPDYIVPLTPGDRMNGRDPQLEKAIELMNAAVIEYDKEAKPYVVH